MLFYKFFIFLFFPIVVFSDKNTLRLVQFNTQWLFTEYNHIIDCPGKGCIWKNKKESDIHFLFISKILNELHADIINLCEVQGMHEMKQLVETTNKNYYSYLVNGTDKETYQNNGLLTLLKPSILPYRINTEYQYPIENTNCHYNGSTILTDIPKHFITEFKIDSFLVTLISLHLPAIPQNPAQCAAREAQAQIIQNDIQTHLKKGNEIIVIGDLNDFDNRVLDKDDNIPNSMVLDILKGNEGTFKKKFKLFTISEKIEKSERHTESFDDNHSCRESMIDHILVSPKLFYHVYNVSIYHKYIHNCSDKINWKGYFNSDHDPVIIDFKF